MHSFMLKLMLNALLNLFNNTASRKDLTLLKHTVRGKYQA